MTSFKSALYLILLTLVVAWPISAVQAGASSSELHVEAVLIWGAKNQPAGKKLKPASSELQAKLRKTLKWEHYYEINDKSFRLSGLKSRRVRMSDKCEVEVKRVGQADVIVKLIGEGKVVVNRRQSLEKDDSVVLGGPCENQSAWFVVLRFK